MASPAQRLSLGPWPGGLNLVVNEPSRDIGDPQSLAECINLDVTNEGHLVSRAGCQRLEADTFYTDPSRSCRVLGSVFEDGSLQAVLGIVSSGIGTKIYLSPDGYSVNFWGEVSEPISSVEQYLNTIYLIRSDDGTPTTGGYIVSDNFFTAGVPNAAVSTEIPSGDKTFIFKDRLWIINKAFSTVWFSAPTDPTDYVTTDSGGGGGYFIVNPSTDAGTSIFDVALTNETFYIFKRNDTYLFNYDTNPNRDGVLRLINSALGAFSATVWENDVYAVNTQGVYRIVNGVFIQLDEQLDLRRNADLASVIDPSDLDSPLFIHAAASKLLVGQFTTTLNVFGFNYASMNLNNGAWSTYRYTRSGSTAPGGVGTTAQSDSTWGMEIYPSKDEQFFVRIPSAMGSEDYTLDGISTDPLETRIFPAFHIKLFSYNAGYSSVWKKLHRMFIRGKWTYKEDVGNPDTIISVVYDDNETERDIVLWNYDSPWENVRPQSEFKVAIKQHRFRNLMLGFYNSLDVGYQDAYVDMYLGSGDSLSSYGRGYYDAYLDTYIDTGDIYTVPPNTIKNVPDTELYITGIDFDITVPRGMSSV